MRNDFDFETLVKPGVEAFEFWISFFPTAPLFGVDWRFADMVGVKNADEIDMAVVTEPEPEVKATPEPVIVPEAEIEGAAAPETVEPVAVASETADAAEPLETPEGTAAPDPVAAPEPMQLDETEGAAPAEEPTVEADVERTKPVGLYDAAPAEADDLKLIKGIGPGLERQLNGLGVYRFDQLAGFSESDLIWVDERLTSFKGRCFRDDWIGQAASKIG